MDPRRLDTRRADDAESLGVGTDRCPARELPDGVYRDVTIRRENEEFLYAFHRSPLPD